MAGDAPGQACHHCRIFAIGRLGSGSGRQARAGCRRYVILFYLFISDFFFPAEGIEAEVINLRSIKPLDRRTIIDSVPAAKPLMSFV